MVIQLPGDVLFDSGAETLKADGKKILGQVAEVIRSDPGLASRTFQVAGHTLAPEELLIERTVKEGWEIAAQDGIVLALDTTLDDELRREARVYDTIHTVNRLRRDAGLDISDRIHLSLPEADADQ